MRSFWTESDLSEHWSLTDDEKVFLGQKSGAGKLFLAIQLKHYQKYGTFLEDTSDLAVDIIDFLCAQIKCSPRGLARHESNSRTSRRYRLHILSYLGVRPFDDQADTDLRKWLMECVFLEVPESSYLDELLTDWFLRMRVERPGGYNLSRLLRSAHQDFERSLFQSMCDQLSPTTRSKLDALLTGQEDHSSLSWLHDDVGSVSLESALQAVERVELLSSLDIPQNILGEFPKKLIERYHQRAATESAWELARHPQHIRYPLLVFYCVPRKQDVIDELVDLIIQVIHKISVRAERKVIKELATDLVKVHGKTNLLFRIAEAILEDPEGPVCDVIFPVVNQKTIEHLVKELQSSGPSYTRIIYTKIRTSYAKHYRRMVPRILSVLEFRSNNRAWHVILEAIAIIRANYDHESRVTYYRAEEVPIEGIVRHKWRESVLETSPTGEVRVNRIGYEICVLQTLREKLRCKEIWVVGSSRYRNPDEDLPANFNANREHYYANLGWPLDPKSFLQTVKEDMDKALGQFDQTLPQNKTVRIKYRYKNARWSITPLSARPEPPGIDALKRELSHRWPSTSLLDILKETDLRIGFTQSFTSSASRESLDRGQITRRLLLTLYGLGTNAGLKRVAAGRHGVSYKELLYTRRRYVHKEQLRMAIRHVVNATLEIRLPGIWGEGTTACASDSTQFKAWDQNLLTEWHVRYGGRGVMIYWHVDTQSTCIYSQLKRCSSSEVASMIEGILNHCTNMTVERHYVDTHGQSVVAFAFCYLLGFNLMPRFKGIHQIKLSLPESGKRDQYTNITPMLSAKAINWTLIAQHYDEIIKLATALKERTADPEAILRRFTRSNVQHPTYGALMELGKAIKTVFLCKYLMSEDLRREIHAGLNVVECWNGVNNFIYFGKGGEMATNRLEDQEVSALSLHLLQASLVYINTLMIQQVLQEPEWGERMSDRDMEALSPLPHGHINPYGHFDLDMHERLPLGGTWQKAS